MLSIDMSDIASFCAFDWIKLSQDRFQWRLRYLWRAITTELISYTKLPAAAAYWSYDHHFVCGGEIQGMNTKFWWGSDEREMNKNEKNET